MNYRKIEKNLTLRIDDDDQTFIDIGKLSMMCKGYTVEEDA